MATTKFVNRARMTTDTTGTGSTVNLVVAVPKYFTLAEAGLQNGDVVDYIIEDGDDFEIQINQTYSSSGPSLSRGTPGQSKVGGTAGTSQIDLSGGAQVAIVGLAKSFDLSTFTEKSAPALTDLLWGHDSAAGVRKFFTLENLFKASIVNMQVFTSSGTYTPTAGLRSALVIGTGGGAGSGHAASTGADSNAASGGGGAGATAIGLFDAATVGASQSVTVGSGGAGGSSGGQNGGNGGTTSFGALLSAGGGQGGQGSSVNADFTISAGGVGGTATIGDILIPGGDGGGSFTIDTGDLALAGYGGASFWGGGGLMQIRDNTSAATTVGADGRAYGSGGSGAMAYGSSRSAAGGSGASGMVVVLEFC